MSGISTNNLHARTLPQKNELEQFSIDNNFKAVILRGNETRNLDDSRNICGYENQYFDTNMLSDNKCFISHLLCDHHNSQTTNNASYLLFSHSCGVKYWILLQSV